LSKKFNDAITEQIKQAPKMFARQALVKKLRELGLEDEATAKTIADRLVAGETEQITFELEGDGFDRQININVTKDDLAEVIRDTELFMRDKLPDMVMGIVRTAASLMSKGVKARWPEERLSERINADHFKGRLELRWSAGLDPLRMMLIAAREIGSEFSTRLSRSRAKTGIAKREALLVLHVRACQTSHEIIVLLENGFADGAYARWRTLYEISVVAFVIERFGDGLAERYLAHDAVATHDMLENEFRHAGIPFEPSKLTGDAKEIERLYQVAIERYGLPFKTPYGWAAESLGKKKPTFQDLEQAVNWNALPPDYKQSSQKVHAGISGAIRSLAGFGGGWFIHSGSSNAGLEVPAVHTAYSLLQVTSLVFGNKSDLTTQARMHCMLEFRDAVERECNKAAKKLYKDEYKIRKEEAGEA
jgi:hypothetical protein